MLFRGKARSRRANARGRADHSRPHYTGVRGAQIHVLSRRAAARAAGALRHADPLATAAIGLTRMQIVALYGLLAMTGGLLCLAPYSMAILVHHALWAFFAASIVFRAVLLTLPAPDYASGAFPAKDDLPVYTVLIPLYQETEVLEVLQNAVDGLHYPTAKLDIKLLLEADDIATIRAVARLPLGPHWEVLIVPDVGPKTKPKALNAGLSRARGAFVTIYDAEDRPHPDQLMHAARAFAADQSGRLGCVQAPLGYYNAAQNWLTQQFALEYAAHFQVLVPAMSRLGLPFPLGGTSNHFRLCALRAVGGWDPYNVTEDADLGYRLNANGWRLGVIAPPTGEEAVSRILPWRRQRSRWLKGYVQTMGVHMRRPAKENALAGAFSMAATLGTAVIAALGHASFMIIMAGLLLLGPRFGPVFPVIDFGLAVAGLLVGISVLAVGAKRAGLAFSFWDLPGAVLYWPLQSWAMAKAIWDLFARPFHWEKTTHGQCPQLAVLIAPVSPLDQRRQMHT